MLTITLSGRSPRPVSYTHLRPESVIVNIDRYGNTTAGTIPLAMNTAIEDGKLKKGSLVLMASVGAGFTVGATLLRWAF